MWWEEDEDKDWGVAVDAGVTGTRRRLVRPAVASEGEQTLLLPFSWLLSLSFPLPLPASSSFNLDPEEEERIALSSGARLVL